MELDNKHALQAVAGKVSRQSAELSHAKHMIHFHVHNNKRDKAVEHITNIKPKSLDWPVREAIRESASGNIDGDIFPGEEYHPKVES